MKQKVLSVFIIVVWSLVLLQGVINDVGIKGEHTVEVFLQEKQKQPQKIQLEENIKEQLTKPEQLEKAKQFLSMVNGTIQEIVVLDDVISVYGYSKNVGGYVWNNEKKVNINVTFTLSEEGTTVHIASPFYNECY